MGGLSTPDSRSDWEEFMGLLSPSAGDRILDIGAGDGKKAALVLQASHDAEVYAVDPNQRKVTAANRDHPAVRSTVGSAESIPFPDSYFDKAYTTMALHHYSDLDKAMGEIARVLRQGGSFTVVEVDPGSAKGRVFRVFGRLMGEHMSLLDFEPLSLRLRGANGFRLASSAKVGSSFLFQLIRA
jgi:ubiquinone/menaquinone biosynthesis C-methylase UbiE